MKPNQLICGGNIDVVKPWPANCIDGIVTDAPYELGFMGKKWDSSGIAYNIPMWKQMLRITKPGGFLLCFGATRTFHRLVCAIEDAGWQIRDCVSYLHDGNPLTSPLLWVSGQGFPKSHNFGCKCRVGTVLQQPNSQKSRGRTCPKCGGLIDFRGYGTALKPSIELIVVAMKPLDGTFAHNAEAHGVAGLNIDGGRIGTEQRTSKGMSKHKPDGAGTFRDDSWEPKDIEPKTVQGRWPANLVFDEEAGAMLDEQTGTKKSGFMSAGTKRQMSDNPNKNTYGKFNPDTVKNDTYGDSGGCSRFFKQIELTIEDLIWNNTFVNYAEKLLWIIEATIENIVPSNVWDWHKELKDLNARFVEKKLGLCEIYTALLLAGIKNLDSNQEALQAIQDSIGNCNECTLILNPVLSVVNQENIDIIQTTINLLKSYGYVRPATKKCTQKTSQSEPSRFKYVPKTSRKERNMGMDDCEDKLLARSGGARQAEKSGKDEYIQKDHIGLNKISRVKNNHPTVKPLALMKYLCTLLKMPSAEQIILDPFMGSGTTGMACKEIGINFIGIEKEREYCEIAVKRIAAVKGKEITLETSLPINKKLPHVSESKQRIIDAAVAELRKRKKSS